MNTIIYAIFDSKYFSALDAARAGGWVYVGKTEIQPNVDNALRVLNEHVRQGAGRHGQRAESFMLASPFKKSNELVRVYLTPVESLQNPTQNEREFMNLLERHGAQIINERR